MMALLLPKNNMKKCTKCYRILNEINFHKQKNTLDGLRYKCKDCRKKYQQNHKISKERRRLYRLKYRVHDREYQREYRKRINRLRDKLGTRIYMALKRQSKKAAKTMDLIGCNIKFLRNHLEKQFKKGMSWSNYGKWHLDHIKPCAIFDLRKPEEQRKCFHYTNLQPLWAEENMAKHDKIL